MTNQEIRKLERCVKRNTKRQSYKAANRWAKVALQHQSGHAAAVAMQKEELS